MSTLKIIVAIDAMARAWSIESHDDKELSRVGDAITAFADFVASEDDDAPETYLYKVLLDEMVRVERALLLCNVTNTKEHADD